MGTEEALLHRFGPILSLAQLAQILDRSADSVRVSLRRETLWATHISAARFKLGRRVYFRTAEIARFLDKDLQRRDPGVER